MMKNIKHLATYGVILLLLFAMTACAPQIYGARKHRKDRNCGCEYNRPQKQYETCNIMAEIEMNHE